MSNLEIITCENRDKWNSIVKKASNWDVYYLWEYAISLKIHGDGEPLLIYYKGSSCEVYYVVMQKDIADDTIFSLYLDKGQLFDWETPYGYGGPLINGVLNEEDLKQLNELLGRYCESHGIVTQFIRFHPLLENQTNSSLIIESAYLKQTIFIDTSEKELIMKNMDSKNRNMIRKAQKSGVSIFCDNGEYLDAFIDIYNSTMDQKKAQEYYYFSRDYYYFLRDNMKENVIFFYAVYEKRVIGASIFFFNENFLHYHLSGTYIEFRKLAPTNLLLYEAALWANDHGISKLHLGGGVGSEDSLFGFKKQFNKNGYLSFYVGRTIFNQKAYKQLMQLRKKNDTNFDLNNNFLIQYRK